ncbi:MAG: retropepsin-like aspartic protease family protein [Candidatus Binatia bacterium]
MGAVAFFTLTLTGGLARSASTQAPAKGGEVMVYAAADESSPLIESVRDGAALSPMGEMTGAGGEKWFMVKTLSGNVGWIKADENSEAKRLDSHFRSLPKDTGMIGPASSALEPAGKVSTTGAVRIPIKMIGNAIVVPVTFINGNSSITGNLLVDTGASQTVLSKRMASGLRLFSQDSQTRVGIGGAVKVDVSVVESIKVGAADAKNMRVSIHDFSPDPRYEGLLGFDFLGRFQMSVDAAKQVMVLAPHQK